MTHVVALSGGHDSTALALRLAEVEPREYVYLCTPTGNELPEMVAHWAVLELLLKTPLTRITNGTLRGLIDEFGALPNWRQRWCTRRLKIEPCLAFLARHAPAMLYVGLRADEEEREGLYGSTATYRYPLREWGWGEPEVQRYLAARGVVVPDRTDCAWCYQQRLVEWHGLLVKHPAVYQEAEELEAATGHTFRSPSRDSYPAALRDCRERFAARGWQLPLYEDEVQACRVCRL